MRANSSRNEQNRVSVRDRRIGKTRKALHEALGSLIVEKPYDAIGVQEILDRANVGRTTFYTHFRDKDALLAESIRDMLPQLASNAGSHAGKWHERIIAFSETVFEHHDRHRRTREAKMGARGRAMLHEHLRAALAQFVGDALEGEFGNRRTAGTIPQEVLAQFVASTFVLVLNWWVESRKPLAARDVNVLFRSLVVPVLVTFK